MYSSLFAREFQISRLKRQENIAASNYRSHFLVYNLHPAFLPISNSLFKFMHTGDLEIKSSQIKLFLHALKCLKINIPVSLAEDLCLAIGHEWLDSTANGYETLRREREEEGKSVLSFKILEGKYSYMNKGQYMKVPYLRESIRTEKPMIKVSVLR